MTDLLQWNKPLKWPVTNLRQVPEADAQRLSKLANDVPVRIRQEKE